MPHFFHIQNFGCRAARADGEAIATMLRASETAEGLPAEADVVIVNTCSVTAEADREARAWIRRAHRLNPNARIIATGCYAQRAPGELAALPGVSAVVGNSHKAFAPEIALGLMKPGTCATSSENHLLQIQTMQAAAAPMVLADDTFAHSFLAEAPIVPGAQTRPNLKIQEGCSNRCSFCVIPQTRGSSRSLPGPAVLAHIRGFVEAGGNELVLSGINLGRWGRDLAPDPRTIRTLAALVRAIFEQTALPRLRLSSVEPMDWDADLIALMREFSATRLARHVHLPLQSGSDSVLRRMYRRYRPWHYAEKVAELLDAAGPGLTLGADVMVGFPGETDREFQESCEFIRSLPFGYLHLFPFSPRPGTRAWALNAENPVPSTVVNERMATLRALAAEKTRSHRAQFVGAELEAITLHTPPPIAGVGRTSALTENFLPVELACELPANQLIRTRIRGLALDETLVGVPAAGLHFHTVQAGFTLEPQLENAF
ncbi:MAG TPA: MiaB/RimO family radical SAM methylthiotransferase [Terracidiphilus sp.]